MLPALNSGRLALTCILVFFGLGGIVMGGNATHLFHPAWPPHARYPLVMGLVAFAALGALRLWFLWRPGQDARLHLRLAALIPLVLIGSLYGAELDVPRVLPPDLLAGTLALLCPPFAYRSARRALTPPAPPGQTSASRGRGG